MPTTSQTLSKEQEKFLSKQGMQAYFTRALNHAAQETVAFFRSRGLNVEPEAKHLLSDMLAGLNHHPKQDLESIASSESTTSQQAPQEDNSSYISASKLIALLAKQLDVKGSRIRKHLPNLPGIQVSIKSQKNYFSLPENKLDEARQYLQQQLNSSAPEDNGTLRGSSLISALQERTKISRPTIMKYVRDVPGLQATEGQRGNYALPLTALDAAADYIINAKGKHKKTRERKTREQEPEDPNLVSLEQMYLDSRFKGTLPVETCVAGKITKHLKRVPGKHLRFTRESVAEFAAFMQNKAYRPPAVQELVKRTGIGEQTIGKLFTQLPGAANIGGEGKSAVYIFDASCYDKAVLFLNQNVRKRKSHVPIGDIQEGRTLENQALNLTPINPTKLIFAHTTLANYLHISSDVFVTHMRSAFGEMPKSQLVKGQNVYALPYSRVQQMMASQFCRKVDFAPLESIMRELVSLGLAERRYGFQEVLAAKNSLGIRPAGATDTGGSVYRKSDAEKLLIYLKARKESR